MYELIFILSNENKKLNLLKIWLGSHFLNYLNDNDFVFSFHYEDDIKLDKIKGKYLYFISVNVFPLLTSIKIQNFIKKNENTIFGKNYKNSILYFKLKNAMANKLNDISSLDKKIHFSNIFYLLNISDKTLKYDIKNICNFNLVNPYSDKWVNITDFDLFCKQLNTNYFTWKNLNKIKLKIANRFSNIIYYDGKNKLESKKLMEKLNINMPKTLKVFSSYEEINFSGLPKNFILKPTNLDGSKSIFKIKGQPLDLEQIKNKLINFQNKNKSKELMPLIRKYYAPSLIAEEFIPSLSNKYSAPSEFKFYVFNNEIKFILGINREIHQNKFLFLDKDFNQFPNTIYSFDNNKLNYSFKKPHYFEKLKEDVLKIYQKFQNDLNHSFISQFIRIDFFITNENYYFGEFSLFPNGGFGGNLNQNGKHQFIRFWVPEIKALLNNDFSYEQKILDRNKFSKNFNDLF